MLILALDTTTRAGSTAIADDDRVLAVHEGDPTRTHGERLPGEIDAVLSNARIDRSQIDLLVVASGPGAFTGLRIGLAAMQGLAMTLGKPIVGVSALDALAWNALSAPEEQVHTILSHGTLQAPSATSVATWMDAQRGEVFSAIYRGRNGREWPWALATEPAVGLPGALLGDESFDRRTPMLFVGDGARRYAETIGTESPNWVISTHDRPLAPALAWIGRRLAAQGHATTPHALQPLYVRRPDAELERDRLINSSAARERERAAGSGDPAS